MAALLTTTVTFLFTDIEGSTRLWEQNPAAMREAMARHDALVDEHVAQHSGTVVRPRGEGDSRFVVFARATHAVAAACALQRAFLAEPWPPPGPLRVRMALHTGEGELRGSDYYGPAVNRCARLRGIAHGGQTLLSSATAELVRDALPEGVSLRPLGLHRLKDLQRPEQVFQLLHPDLPDEFPPLRSLDVLPNNLPIQLTSFIGREREMAEVRRLLSAARLVTLTGSGGCGKTRLALQVAADLLAEYPDGVWLVELGALADPAQVPQAVGTVLGLREEPNRTLTETLSDFLRPQIVLVLLDNCEHLVEACAQMAERLLRACPRLRIMATSREALGIAGEVVWRVPSLALPDPRQLPPIETLTQYEAVRLFVERAVAALPTYRVTNQNARAVAQVCHRLDGIPLAIELAAVRVKVLTPEQIAARLDDRFELLTGGSRTALPRHQTLRAATDWSHDLLSGKERVLFRRLSVFVGGFTLEAVEAICVGEGIEENEVLDLLTQLADKSLVWVEGADGKVRYRLLETVRQYGQDRLRETGEAARVLRRHRDFFLEFAECAEPELSRSEQEVWLNRLEADYANLRMALEWSVESGEVEAGLRLGGALWRFWEVRGYLSEGRGWLEEVLKRSDKASPALRAKALKAAGFLSRYLGDYAAAHSLLNECLAMYGELEDKRGMALSLNNLGVVAGDQGDYERAATFYEESLALSRELGAKDIIAMVLNNLAIVSSRQRHLVVARSRYQESLAIFRELGDKRSIAVSAVNLGIVAAHQGDYLVARALLEESLAIQLELGDKGSISHALDAFGILAAEQGQAKRAARLLGAAEALREAIDAPLPPSERAGHEPDIAKVRAALGEEAFTMAWDQGRAMRLEQAMAYAVEESGEADLSVEAARRSHA